MTISEMISELQRILQEHGDAPIAFSDPRGHLTLDEIVFAKDCYGYNDSEVRVKLKW